MENNAYLLISYYVTSLGKPLVVVDNQRDLCYTQEGKLVTLTHNRKL